MSARRIDHAIAIGLACLLIGAASTASAQGQVTRIDTNPNLRPELEPGTVFVGDWATVYSGLHEMTARPRSDDAEIIASVRAMGDAAPPPYLSEMGRRLFATDPVEGSYWYRVGLLRMQMAAFSCSDATASQGVTMVLRELEEAEEGIVERFDAPAIRLPAYDRIGNGDVVFQSTASPWWICSLGMSAVIQGLGQRGGAVAPLAQWLAPESRRTTMQDRLRVYLPQWAADDRAALAGTE